MRTGAAAKADEGGQRGHEASAVGVFGETAEFAADHLPGVIEETASKTSRSPGVLTRSPSARGGLVVTSKPYLRVLQLVGGCPTTVCGTSSARWPRPLGQEGVEATVVRTVGDPAVDWAPRTVCGWSSP